MALRNSISLPLAATLLCHLFTSVFASGALSQRQDDTSLSLCGVMVDDQRSINANWIADLIVSDLHTCATLCQTDPGCLTFQTGPPTDTGIDCVLFKQSITDIAATTDSDGLYVLYDVYCPLPDSPRDLICGLATDNLDYFIGNQNALYLGSTDNIEACADRCLQEPLCFSYQVSPNADGSILCFLSGATTVTLESTANPFSNFKMSDRDCGVLSSTPVAPVNTTVPATTTTTAAPVPVIPTFTPNPTPTCGACAADHCSDRKRQTFKSGSQPGNAFNCQRKRNLQPLVPYTVASNADCQILCQSTFNCASYLIEDYGDSFACSLNIFTTGRITGTVVLDDMGRYAYYDVNCTPDTFSFTCPVPATTTTAAPSSTITTPAPTPTCGDCVSIGCVKKRDVGLNLPTLAESGVDVTPDSCLAICQSTPKCIAVALTANETTGGLDCNLEFNYISGMICDIYDVGNYLDGRGYYEVGCTVGSLIPFNCPASIAGTTTNSSTIPSSTHTSTGSLNNSVGSVSTSTGTFLTSTSTPVPSSTHTSTGSLNNSVGSVSTSTGTFLTSTSAPALTSSTAYKTTIYTITSCAATVTDCPARIGSLTTETISLYTTIYPVSQTSVPLLSTSPSHLGPSVAASAVTHTESSFIRLSTNLPSASLAAPGTIVAGQSQSVPSSSLPSLASPGTTIVAGQSQSIPSSPTTSVPATGPGSSSTVSSSTVTAVTTFYTGAAAMKLINVPEMGFAAMVGMGAAAVLL